MARLKTDTGTIPNNKNNVATTTKTTIIIFIYNYYIILVPNNCKVKPTLIYFSASLKANDHKQLPSSRPKATLAFICSCVFVHVTSVSPIFLFLENM